MGEEVMKSLTPAQQVIKIVNDELVDLMGGTSSKLTYSPKGFTVYMMVGLQGTGKTTTCGKLAMWLKKNGKKPMLCARYGIDALGAMAQGLFCSLLVGTILNTIGTQFNIGFLTKAVATVGETSYTVGGIAMAMCGPAMAVAIGYALKSPPLVLFSMVSVGYAANTLGGAGGPLSVLFIAIIAAEIGKMVSKETKIDILVTPIVTSLKKDEQDYYIRGFYSAVPCCLCCNVRMAACDYRRRGQLV